MGPSDTRHNYEFHLAGDKLQESACEKGSGFYIVPRLFPEHHIKRNVTEASTQIQRFLQVRGHRNVKKKVCTTQIQTKVCHTSLFTPLERTLICWRSPKGANKDCKIRTIPQGEASGHGITHIGREKEELRTVF